MKIRDGYEVKQTKSGIPVVLFRGRIIVKFVWYPIHPIKPVGMVLEYGLWSADSTARERLEGAMFFWHQIDIPLIGYARRADNPFFEHLAKHGYCRKTGVSFIVFDDEVATVWESTHERRNASRDGAAATIESEYESSRPSSIAV